MKLIAIFAMLAVAFAQEDSSDVGSSGSVVVKTTWPQNENNNGGAMIDFVYKEIGEGSCIVSLPKTVTLFHVMNGHIVLGDATNPLEGRYKICAPAGWEAVNGSLNVLVLFERDHFFNSSEIEFKCDRSDVNDISIYSFPQNSLVEQASSDVHFRPGFHRGDVVTITFPTKVARFNVTTGDTDYAIDSEGGQTYTIGGFKNPRGIDNMKELHFSIDYVPTKNGIVGDNWFSAGQITVSVTQEKVEEEEEP